MDEPMVRKPGDRARRTVPDSRIAIRLLRTHLLPHRLVMHRLGSQFGLRSVREHELLKLLPLQLPRLQSRLRVLAVGSGHWSHSVKPGRARRAQLPEQGSLLRAGLHFLLEQTLEQG
jgi:hypothetical protein